MEEISFTCVPNQHVLAEQHPQIVSRTWTIGNPVKNCKKENRFYLIHSWHLHVHIEDSFLSQLPVKDEATYLHLERIDMFAEEKH